MDRNTDTAGLCLSVLLAPRTGRESRESVRRSVDKAVKKGRTYVERVRVQDGDGAEEATEE
jgi:hypothetical protein